MSNYPDAEDVFTPVTGTDEMSEHAERHTAEEEAIVAIQQTLGANPEGTSTTVVERLDAIDSHTHDDLAAGDHNHDGDYAAEDHDHDLVYQPKGDYATEDHTHDDLAAGDHTHDSDDTKLDKGTTTYLDAKAIEDDISGIEQSISDLSDNYDQIVIDLGEAGQDLTVELESYLKKGTASYADAAGIESDIDQEKIDRAAGDAATLSSSNTYTDEEVAKIVVPDVSDFVTGDDLTTALSGKADEPHTHDEYLTDLTHDHDSTYQPVGDYATTEELTDGLAGKSDDGHTHDTTHNHEEYFLSGAETDEFGQPIPLPYANAKLLGDEVDTKADEDHTHDAPEINTSQVTLAADAGAGFHELGDGTEVLTQADVNVYLSENTVFKGATWGDLAGRA